MHGVHRQGNLSLRYAAAAIAPSFALSRILIIALTLATAAWRRQSPLMVWDQWDTKWYVGIALHGYHWGIHGKPALAFFPLYPLLLHCLSGLGVPLALGGLLLSNAAFAAALLYLFLFTQLEWGPHAARRATWLIALFPTAFFTFAPYTESVFLLCAVAVLYHARRRDALASGLWLAAAIATRSTGLILIPAAFAAMEQHSWKRRLPALIPSAVATAAYVWYLGQQRLSIVQLFTAQRAWHRELAFPWTGFTASLSWLAQYGSGHPAWSLENGMSLAVTVFFLLLTIAAWRFMSRAMALYCAAFWLLVLTSPEWLNRYYAPFSSMDRFVLALFPLAGWVAARASTTAFRRTIAANTVLMGALTVLHLSGGWVG